MNVCGFKKLFREKFRQAYLKSSRGELKEEGKKAYLKFEISRFFVGVYFCCFEQMFSYRK